MTDERLLEAVKAEVRRQLSLDNKTNQILESNVAYKEEILVLGDASKLPNGFLRKPHIHIVEGKNNIGNFHKIIITEMTMSQLVDISLGRDADEFCKTILLALLQDKEVLLLESAFYHRTVSQNFKNAIYIKMEKYVNELYELGAKPYVMESTANIATTEKNKCVCEKLISERTAFDYVRTGVKELHIQVGAIITPSAKDVFRENKVELCFL